MPGYGMNEMLGKNACDFFFFYLTFLTLDIILLQGYSTLIAFSESNLMNTFYKGITYITIFEMIIF